MTMDLPNRFLTTADENLNSLSGSGGGFVGGTSRDTPSTLSTDSGGDDVNLPSYIDNFPPLSQNGFHAPASNGSANGNVYSSALASTSTHVNNGNHHGGGGQSLLNKSYFSDSNESIPSSLQPVTQLFTIPFDERYYAGVNSERDNMEQKRICKQVQDDFNVVAELTTYKDRSICIMVSGRPESVKKARRQLLASLQKQVEHRIIVPKEFHGAILGKGASRLRELESETATKISVPPQNSQEETIRISGPREGIESAKHKLEVIAAEQAKIGFERIKVPKLYHPFIVGASGRNVEEWQAAFNCKIHVPPPSLNNDEIVLNGEKAGVETVRDKIYQIIHEKERTMTKLEVTIDKAKHKYIIGPRGKGIQEILALYDVSVEVPPLDNPSTSIVLRGSSLKLGEAVTMVYHKAESFQVCNIPAPAWIHKYLIGKDGSKIQEITAGSLAKVHVEFTDDCIVLDGQTEAMNVVRQRLTEEVDDLLSKLSFAELTVDSRYHKHIVGKQGSNIKSLSKDKNVRITVPNEMDGSNIIRVEGDKTVVPGVVAELQTLITRVENEKSLEVKIEQRLHRLMIGSGGEAINKIRNLFPDVSINFPDNNKRSDFVVLRGPKDQVEKCSTHLKKIAKDLAESNYELQVSVMKKFHKNIIGKDGTVINQIRRDTSTRIEMPSEAGGSDSITIIGLKANAEKAKKKILEIESQLANIMERTIDIPFKQHKALIGRAGAHIKAIVAECGDNITIHFPQDGGNKVAIRGDKKDVDKAVKLLQDEATKMGEAAEDVTVKQAMHRFLIGREGSNVRRLQEETGCRILFDNSDIVTILGSKTGVAKAKADIEQRVLQLESTIESEIDIEQSYHKFFMQNNRRILNNIIDECGGLIISFPPQNSNNSKIRIKGPQEFVELAKQRLLQTADDFIHQTAAYVDIAPKNHRTVLGNKGFNVQGIESDCNVRIKFPDVRAPVQGESPRHQMYGIGQVNGPDGQPLPPQEPNQVLVVGRQSNIDKASELLLALVPVEKIIEIRQEFHRQLIGQGGGRLREMQARNNVHIAFPKFGGQAAKPAPAGPDGEEEPALTPDTVIITGSPTNVDAAAVQLAEAVVECEAQKEDYLARQFQTKFHVDPKHHNKIIGQRGANIQRLRQVYDVQINLPKNGAADEPIVLIGYENKANECMEEIKKQVAELDSFVTVTLEIDTRVHPRLIGAKGRNLHKICEDFKVDVRFPGQNSSEPNQVTITGPEKNVEECQDKLMSLAEDFMDDILENDWQSKYKAPDRAPEHDNKPKADNPGFLMRDTPWNPTDDTDFPTLGGKAPVASWPVARH
jgi:predicted RNA-binding protein YlqC (UPF0109 family)